MKKIKLSFPPEKWDFAKYSPNGTCVWGEYEFFLNQEIENPDYWIVILNTVLDVESACIEHDNVIFYAQENKDILNYSNDFLSQFTHVFTFREDIDHPNVKRVPAVLPWFVNKNYNELSTTEFVEKSKKMSLLTSNNRSTIKHIKRLNFTKKIHNYFGNEIDFYGDDYTGRLTCKTSTLDPYMFTFALESFSISEYFSEKLADSYLSHCFPIYYGCNNLNEYFDKNSFALININDVSQSIKVIKDILDNDDFYDARLKYVIEAKNKYLREYSIFPLMSKIIDEVEVENTNRKNAKRKDITINKFIVNKNIPYYVKRANVKLYDKLTKLINI